MIQFHQCKCCSGVGVDNKYSRGEVGSIFHLQTVYHGVSHLSSFSMRCDLVDKKVNCQHVIISSSLAART